MNSIVYSANAENKIKGLDRLLDLMEFSEMIKAGERVVIKPNFCAPLKSSSGGITKPILVVHLAERVRELGAIPIIAESAIGVGLTDKSFTLSGLKQLCELKKIRLVNLEKQPFMELDGFEVSSIIQEADKLINFPVMKTHKIGVLVATLSLKNLMGLFSSKQKTRLHINGIDESIVGINKLVTPDLNIMDATVGMEGQAPTRGKLRKMGMLFASRDRVALDSFCTKFMGVPLPKHVKLAETQKIGTLLYEVKGDAVPEIKPFKQGKPDFVHKFFDRQKGQFLSLPVFNQLWVKFYQFVCGGTKAKVNFPMLDKTLCKRCGLCRETCPKKAIALKPYPEIDTGKCAKCFACAEVCPENALTD